MFSGCPFLWESMSNAKSQEPLGGFSLWHRGAHDGRLNWLDIGSGMAAQQ